MQSCCKSGGTKCSYINCDNTSAKNPELSFFRFPIKDKERCLNWIVNSGNDDFAELSDNKLRSRVLCSVHFNNSSFTNTMKNRLLQNQPSVVPIPWFHDVSPQDIEAETLASKVILSTSEGHKKRSEESEQTLEEFCNDFRPLPEVDNSNEVLSVSGINSKHENSPTPRKKKLISTLSRKKMQLKRKLNTIHFLNRKSKPIDLITLISTLKNFISGEPLTFLTMQLRHQKKCNWSEEEKNIALSLYYKSPSVYKFLRERGYRLPSLSQIRIWVNVHNVQPGFGEEIFGKLKKKVESMSEDEKECVVLLDEMSIKQALEYNSKFDVVEGFQDLGPLGREGSIATHANVFMIRGLKHPWKCPVSYVLSHNSIKHTSLVLLIDICISKLVDAGFYPKAIVNDLGSTNAAATRLLGASSDTPYITFNNEKIYCLFDFPHLTKCIRNNLMKYDFLVDGKLVSWGDLKLFYEMDKANSTDCRAAPKLSERHVNPQCFQKMSVKLATQVFSHTVSKGMKTAAKLGVLNSPTFENTAELFGRFNDIFDCMNSKNLYERNPYKKPMSKVNGKTLKCLEDAIPFIESWSVVGSPNPPCFEGLLQTIRAALGLYYDMCGDSFLMTGRLNQDPIENLFGVIRQRGGFNSNPTAKEFRRNLQHSMSIRLLDPPDSSNCEPDSDTTLQVGFDNDGQNTLSAQMPPITQDFNVKQYSLASSIDTGLSSQEQKGSTPLSSNKVQLGPFEDNVICYIAGWLAKRCIEKFSCNDCSHSLKKHSSSLLTDKETLLVLKSFTCHTEDIVTLIKPSEELHIVIKQQSLHFMECVKSKLHVRNLRSHIEESMERDTQEHYPMWWSSSCKDHRLYMMKLLIKCKLHNSLKWKSNDLRDRVVLKFFKNGKKRVQKNNKPNPKLKKLKHV